MKVYIDATTREKKMQTTLVSVYLDNIKVVEGMIRRAHLNIIEFPYSGGEIDIRFDVVSKSNGNKYSFFETETYENLSKLGDEYYKIATRLEKKLKRYKREWLDEEENDDLKKVKIEKGFNVTVPSVSLLEGEENYKNKDAFYSYSTNIEYLDPNKEAVVLYFEEDKYIDSVSFAVPMNTKDNEKVVFKRKLDSKKLEKIYGKYNIKSCIIALIIFLVTLSITYFLFYRQLEYTYKTIVFISFWADKVIGTILLFILPNLISIGLLFSKIKDHMEIKKNKEIVYR